MWSQVTNRMWLQVTANGVVTSDRNRMVTSDGVALFWFGHAALDAAAR